MRKFIVTLIILNIALLLYPSDLSAREIKAEEIIRLHVIANSDEKEDQELKLKVRDEIIATIKPSLEEAENRDDVEKIINNNLEEIERVAKEKVEKEGYSYSVKAQLGDFLFPIKAYNDFVLPAGEYRALKVIIGEGAGKNWWCVMFPPLCYVDLNHQPGFEKAEASSLEKNSVEVNSVKNSAESNKEVNVEVRFKVVELWDTLKTKVSSWF